MVLRRSNRWATSFAAVLMFAALGNAAQAQEPGITDLGAINGGRNSSALGVSGDGSVVVGFANDGSAPFMGIDKAFRWTQSGGMESLGVLRDSASANSQAAGVSSDGNVVVGNASDGQRTQAFRWTRSTGMVSLGSMNGGPWSFATATSSNGTVIVGYANDTPIASSLFKAYRWTETTGMVNLGVLNGGIASFATAVNSDGLVVVGSAADGAADQFTRAFRWSEATGMVSLGVLNGGYQSVAWGVSGDGNIVVGEALTADSSRRAFRWTQAGGMVSLGTLTDGWFSAAKAISTDGRVVVGIAADGPIGNYFPRAFRWTQTTGMQTVEGWLRANGIRVPADITMEATAVNRDGNVIVGNLLNGFAFIARVSPIGSGLVTLQDLQSSLSGNTNGATQAASVAGMVLNGAHSQPLARRVAAGKSCFWTAGDVGRDDHGESDGSLGVLEIGGCHSLTRHVQGALSVGRTSSRQNLAFDGRTVVRGTYGIAELLGNIPGTSLWPSAAVLHQSGDAEARRGYVNAGLPDSSHGTPPVRTSAVRARVDWENAGQAANIVFSPYVDMSHSRTRVNGYTESGGGLPAQFDARMERATEARLGVDASYAVSSHTQLQGRLEAAHRFERGGAASSGNVIGLFSFTLPGQQVKRDWLRVGAGLVTRLGGSTLSAFLNATTQGAAPSCWINVSYQVSF
jgi:probable HAF family extracellular repeat protein